MLICVYMNPTIDKTVYVSELKVGGTNRADSVILEGAGKAVNAAVAAKELGMNVKVMGLSYNEDGMLIKDRLEEKSIFYDFYEKQGGSRTNTKIFDESAQMITEINEAGAPADEKTVSHVADKVVAAADKKDIVLLTGSLPPECPKDFYAQLILRLKQKNVRCALDASGEELAAGVAQQPFFIKPNIDELKQIADIQSDSLEEIKRAALKLIADGIEYVAVSMGEKGAVLATKDTVLYAKSPEVEVKSTVGAGDSMVAGMLSGLSVSPEEALKRGVAAAAASVTLRGTQFCTKELFENYLNMVEVAPVE